MRKINITADLAAIEALANRHTFDEGICRSCGQPWPCDVHLIQEGLFLKEEVPRVDLMKVPSGSTFLGYRL